MSQSPIPDHQSPISNLKSKIPALSVLLLLLLGLGLRLYDLTDPPIDFHPTRQLRGAIVARGMYYQMLPGADPEIRQKAINFWESTGDYEPPFLERLVAITDLAVGGEYPWIARIYNALMWIIGGAALFALSHRAAGAFGALFALAYYLILPFSVQASRSFQPDPGMVMWMALFAWSVYRWSEEWRSGGFRRLSAASWKWSILAGVFAGLAVLTKAIAAYTIAATAISIVLYTIIHEHRQSPPASTPVRSLLQIPLRIVRSPQIWAMVLLMVIPSGLFYLTQGGRAAQYFSSWTLALSHLLLGSELYLRWINLVQELMSWQLLLLGLIGVILAKPRLRALLTGLWLGYICYGLFLPYQMYTHNYYHLQVILILALSLAPVAQVIAGLFSRVIHKLTESSSRAALRLSLPVILASLAAAGLTYYSWLALTPLRARDYRDEPALWQTVASRLPADGKIIALTQDYGYRLMYYGWRKVSLWPNRGELKLNELRGSEKEFETYFFKQTQGMRYFLITSFRQFDDQPDLQAYLEAHYPILAQGADYLIYDLSSPH